MKEILKQSSVLFFAQILTRVISFFYTIFLAKSLGVLEFGLLTIALSYFSIISSIADFGFNRFIVREIAKDQSKIPQLLWNIAMLRLTLTSVIFAVFAILLYILDPDKMRVSLILLATLAILPQSIALTLDGIFVALRKLQFSAIAIFLSSLTTSLVGLFLVTSGFGLMGAINALIFGQLIYFIVLTVILFKNQGLIFSSVKLFVIKNAIWGALPYGILGVLGLLYFRIDAIILSYIKGSFETGIYGAAFRFLEAVTFIPTAFFSALFPVFAKIHTSDKNQVKKLYFKSLKLLGGLGVIILLGYLLILPTIIKIFLPDYLSSIRAISILSLAIPFMLMQVAAVSVLISTDKFLKQVLLLSLLTLIFNILANLIFIPQFGFIAASWVTTFSEVLSFIVFFIFIKQKILSRN